MKNPIKTIKNWLSFILTALVFVALFGVIFIKSGLVTPSASFFTELGIVLALTFLMKIWWYDYSEDKRLNEEDIRREKEHYFELVDKNIKDSNDLDKYLVLLNKENHQHYVENKIGSRTARNMAKKNWWICLWHKDWKKKTDLEIGQIRYDKLYFKCQRKADKLRKIKSEEIMALSDSKMLYDSKNHTKSKKRGYQTITTILSFVFMTMFASVAFEQMMLNWTNAFRYIGYACAMIGTIAITILTAYKQTGDATLDYYSRLKFIIDKYVTYKEKEEKANG